MTQAVRESRPAPVVRRYLEMVRFSHTLFALPFALLAALLAWHANAWDAVNFGDDAGSLIAWHNAPQKFVEFRWLDLVGILACMVTARSAAMAFNRLADRRIDALNPRTSGRHLPSGSLRVRGVMIFVALTSIAFVASTLLFLPNWLPLAGSIPVLAFLCGYSFAKRFTSLSHFWLGAALALAPIAAWIAIRGAIVLAHPFDILPAIVLAGAVLFWVSGFDMIYACQDAEFDAKSGLHSVPARFGIAGALRLAGLCHAIMIGLLIALAWVFPPLGAIYLVGIGAVAVLLAYEHWLVRPDDLTRVNIAFFNVNIVVSLGLFALAAIDLWL